jgi:uncharacterized protein YndB with AHSA1/START domain
MHVDATIDIEAPPETVWAVLADVERWPGWTPTMTWVRWLDGGALAVGSAARIKQPRLPATTWRVTRVEPGRSFVWAASRAGVTTVAEHRLTPQPDGVAVHLGIRQSGPLAWLVGLFASRMVGRYPGMEAEALKQRCEGEGEPSERRRDEGGCQLDLAVVDLEHDGPIEHHWH